MTWRKGEPAAANPADRLNRLMCEGIIGFEGTGRDTRAVPCQATVTGFQTAQAARSGARADGWQWSKPLGDRCPLHRVARRRPAGPVWGGRR